MICHQCTFDNRQGANFCQQCGSRLRLACRVCSTVVLPGSRFCDSCGNELSASGPPSIHPSEASSVRSLFQRAEGDRSGEMRIGRSQTPLIKRTSGERKIVSALFADIKDSMQFLGERDADLAARIIGPALGLMVGAVQRYEGRVPTTLGDGIFALFGAPVAQEDHALRAIHAALEIQNSIRIYGETLIREHGISPIQVRIGINSGEAVFRPIANGEDQEELIAVGHSTGVAARLEKAAEPGSILVSTATRRMAEEYFEFREIEHGPMKGVGHEIGTHLVLGPNRRRKFQGRGGSSGERRLIGRSSELERLRTLLDAARQGRGQVVGLSGEAGVGKSRLTQEIKRLAEQDCLILEGAAVPHGGKSPFLPLVNTLNNYFQILLDDDDSVRLLKVREGVSRLAPELLELVPFLLMLLGIPVSESGIAEMDPRIRRHRTMDALGRLILREAQLRPVLIIIEDLHWIDRESERFLVQIGRDVPRERIMLLTNFRPDFRPRFDAAVSHVQLRLEPFSETHARALISERLGEDIAPDSLKSLIIQKTQGNPFFIEEYVKSLQDERLLARDSHLDFSAKLTEIKMPSTVQAVLAARIDRLGADDKALLQLFSVLGASASLRLIEQAAGALSDLTRASIDRLVSSEFILEIPGLQDENYVFRHALTRETVYSSLLSETRRELHARAAAAIEECFADRLMDRCGELAQHYGYAENYPKAVEYLMLAGTQAMQKSGYSAAIDHFLNALEILPRIEDIPLRNSFELKLQTQLAVAYTATRGFAVPEVRSAYERARLLCGAETATVELLRVFAGLGIMFVNSGELRAAVETGEALLALAEERQEAELFVSANELLGFALLRQGKLRAAREKFDHVLKLLDLEGSEQLRRSLGRDPVVSCRAFRAMARWLEGFPDEALTAAQDAARAAREFEKSHTISLFFALHPLYWIHLFRQEAHEAEVVSLEAADLASEHGFQGWFAHSQLIIAWASAMRGTFGDVLSLIDTAEEGYAASGGVVWRPLFMLVRAEVLQKDGSLQEALQAIERGLADVDVMGEYWFEAELLRRKGELLLAILPRNEQEAAMLFAQAATLAMGQGATSLELRARTSLFRLTRSASSRAELQRVLQKFTEGLDTADLKDARHVLDEVFQP